MGTGAVGHALPPGVSIYRAHARTFRPETFATVLRAGSIPQGQSQKISLSIDRERTKLCCAYSYCRRTPEAIVETYFVHAGDFFSGFKTQYCNFNFGIFFFPYED